MRDPLHVIGYAKAVELLRELRDSQGSGNLDILLRMAECEIFLKRGKEKQSIQAIRDFVFSSGNFLAFDLRNKAYQLRKNGDFVCAIILYKISNTLYAKTNAPPEDKLIWISDRLVAIQMSTRALVLAGGKSRGIAIEYGIKYMEESLEDLRSVSNATKDSKAQREGKCLAHLAFICNFVGEHEKSIRFGKDGLTVYKNRFGSDASKHKFYAWSLQQLAKSYVGIKRFSEAEKFLVKAEKACETATDFENEYERIKMSQAVGDDLDVARNSSGQSKRK